MNKLVKVLVLAIFWPGCLFAALLDSSCIDDPGYYICKGSIVTDTSCKRLRHDHSKVKCTISNSSGTEFHSVSESHFTFSVTVSTDEKLGSVNRSLSAECIKSAACTEKYSCNFYSTEQEELCYEMNPHNNESI